MAFTLVLTGAIFAHAQEGPEGNIDPNNSAAVDTATAKALQQTQALLTNPAERQKAVKTTPDAKRVDDAVNEMAGGKPVSNDVYSLAADVFANMVKQSNGDPVKMQEALEKFQKDPASFANGWTPEQKKKLRDLAGKLTPTVNTPQ